MFELKETDKGVELYLSNSEEHARTGIKLRSFTYTFPSDEWVRFTEEVLALEEKMYPDVEAEPEPEVESDEPEPEIEEDLREDLRGQADQIHDILEDVGSLTYEELGNMLEPPVKAKRASNIVSTMIRDGVELKREGSPRKVSIG